VNSYRKILGTPRSYRTSRPTRDFPSSEVGVLPPSSEYVDVYEIKTALNTYELRIDYETDDSEISAASRSSQPCCTF